MQYTRRAKFKSRESDTYKTQVLYCAMIPNGSKGAPVGEETIQCIFQSQSDHRESYGLDEFVYHSTFELRFQLSLGISHHAWPRYHKPVESLVSRAPNITELCLDGRKGSTASSTNESTTHQTREDDYWEERVTEIGYPRLVMAVVLLLLLCVRKTRESSTVYRIIILESFGEIVIEWEFRRRQRVICIDPLLDLTGIDLANAIKLVSLRAKSKFELGRRLHFEPVSYWHSSNSVIVEDTGGEEIYLSGWLNRREMQWTG